MLMIKALASWYHLEKSGIYGRQHPGEVLRSDLWIFAFCLWLEVLRHSPSTIPWYLIIFFRPSIPLAQVGKIPLATHSRILGWRIPRAERFFFSPLLSSYRLPPLLFPHKSTPKTPAHTTLNITYICHERKRETASSSWWLGRAHRPDYTEGEPKSFSRYSPPHQFLHSLSTLLSQKYSCLIVFFVVFIFFPSTPGEWK